MPGDDLACQTLAALRTAEGRARMRELAIGPAAFQYSEERAIASALMEERGFAPEERCLLDRDDGRFLPWGLAISWTMTPERAVWAIERFAAARARWWLPRWLAWIAQGVLAGNSLAWAITEMETLIAYLKPLIRAEGAR